jgi:hypothetical protein
VSYWAIALISWIIIFLVTKRSKHRSNSVITAVAVTRENDERDYEINRRILEAPTSKR